MGFMSWLGYYHRESLEAGRELGYWEGINDGIKAVRDVTFKPRYTRRWP